MSVFHRWFCVDRWPSLPLRSQALSNCCDTLRSEQSYAPFETQATPALTKSEIVQTSATDFWLNGEVNRYRLPVPFESILPLQNRAHCLAKMPHRQGLERGPES